MLTLPLLFAVLVFVMALRRGAAPERWLSAILLLRMLLVELGASFSGYGAMNVNVFWLLVDIVIFAAIAALALCANRIYPLWVGGAQIVTLSSHLARASLPHWQPAAYVLMHNWPSLIQLVVLSLGIGAHILRDLRHEQAVPSWRNLNL